MERLLTAKQIEILSIPELMLLILSAFFHDIGMAAEEKVCALLEKVLGQRARASRRAKLRRNTRGFGAIVWRDQNKYLVLSRSLRRGSQSMAEIARDYLIADYIKSHARRQGTSDLRGRLAW